MAFLLKLVIGFVIVFVIIMKQIQKYLYESPPKIIVLEGKIGVGKSWFCKNFAKYSDIHIIKEPSIDNPYLNAFYKNPSPKNAMLMQDYLFEYRLKTYKKALKLKEDGKNVMLDRSIYSDQIFARLNSTEFGGNITEEAYKKYQKKSECIKKLTPPDKIIILDSSVETCLENIKVRADRVDELKSEKEIAAEYLENLDICIEDWIEKMKTMGCKVERLDWTNFDTKIDNKKEFYGSIFSP